ncbi:HAD family hydrolase [Variovorax saccharolyticus]|uniref:HAD family hydrolase n=1 Tax=Variovorax saccharolyticus TaxID=3053516 RepID=UPI0025777A76|nr:HAD family hydrolase [Variovorax sp. J22R187]MDM0017913.1 HAD family hydrolase [Variovorax sp. J22R187]
MQDMVFLLDVDNTLLDNDAVVDDLRRRLSDNFGSTSAERYWTFFEELRVELGYTDYLGALQRYRLRELSDDMNDPRLLQMSTFLVDYPFAERLYPGALKVVEHLQRFGTTVILTDGDVVFQPRKVQRSGLWQAVDGRVLIYIHKELMLDAVHKRYPARHYVMVDDKLRILSAMKDQWGDRLTTVFPRQGHYALDPHESAAHPAADITIESIADLLEWPLAVPRRAAAPTL